MSTRPAQAWFLRSHDDGDTHRGRWDGVLLRADCGIVFAPQYLAIGSYWLTNPTDPDQLCPQCSQAPAPPPPAAAS